MLQRAKEQLQPVSIEQIKDILKRNAKSEFDKMIINNEAEIKRTDYYFSVLNYRKAERKLYKITFPLFDSIKNDFSLFEGGTAKFGEKSIMEYESHIDKFLDTKGVKKKLLKNVRNAFEYPFDEENEEVSLNQRKYFLPKFTYQGTCEECSGKKYITCTNSECNGKHVWQCRECFGTGQTTCSKCKGHSYTKCWSCSGTGTKTKTVYRNNGQSYEKTEKCSSCSGKGEVLCNKCDRGKNQCNICEGYGKITCPYCHHDGTIDCPDCLAVGSSGQFVFVETLIKDLDTAKLLKTGDDIELDQKTVLEYVKDNLDFICVYKNVNGKVTDGSDEISKKLALAYENDLALSKTDFPMILKEEMTYQVIPTVKISYKHILTNETHDITIVNFWDKPKILFHSDAEKLIVNTKNILKTVIGVFSKVFKTKGHLKKEDKKTEIKLMIYLAKSDGKIEEQEKEYLSEQISHLKEFKNSEKKELFALVNADELPELTNNDVKFSNLEKGQEIVEKLTQLAHSDGEFGEVEKQLIEKIKTLMDKE